MAVVALAGGLRLWGLTSPPDHVADELYYERDASAYLGGGIGIAVAGAPAATIRDEGTWVHPPLGKWAIAAGVGPLGVSPLGRRLPAAVFGTVGVLLLYLLALHLWGSVRWAGLAALFLALDGLHIVHSRVAMLDIFLTTFVTAGMLFLVLDRARLRPAAPPRDRSVIDRAFGSTERFWAGVMFGAAVSTKWSGVFALLLGAGLCAVWLRSVPVPRPPAGERTRSLVGCFVLLPLGVYLACYSAFFLQHGLAMGDFAGLQEAMLRHNLAYRLLPAGSSSPLTWPLLLHPARYYPIPGSIVPGGGRLIIAVGNPPLWWGSLALAPAVLGALWRRRDERWTLSVALGGYMAMWLPWTAVGRTQFLHYMLPAVPFMCLAAAAGLRSLGDRIRGTAAVAFAAAVVVAAGAYLPFWLGLDVRWPGGAGLPLI